MRSSFRLRMCAEAQARCPSSGRPGHLLPRGEGKIRPASRLASLVVHAGDVDEVTPRRHVEEGDGQQVHQSDEEEGPRQGLSITGVLEMVGEGPGHLTLRAAQRKLVVYLT